MEPVFGVPPPSAGAGAGVSVGGGAGFGFGGQGGFYGAGPMQHSPWGHVAAVKGLSDLSHSSSDSRLVLFYRRFDIPDIHCGLLHPRSGGRRKSFALDLIPIQSETAIRFRTPFGWWNLRQETSFCRLSDRSVPIRWAHFRHHDRARYSGMVI